MGQTAADGEADGHACEWSKARGSPCQRIAEGGRDVTIGALAEGPKKSMAGGADGAEGADGKVGDAEMGRENDSPRAIEAVNHTAAQPKMMVSVSTKKLL